MRALRLARLFVLRQDGVGLNPMTALQKNSTLHNAALEGDGNRWETQKSLIYLRLFSDGGDFSKGEDQRVGDCLGVGGGIVASEGDANRRTRFRLRTS